MPYLIVLGLLTVGIISYFAFRSYLGYFKDGRTGVKVYLIFIIVCLCAAGLTRLLDEETPVKNEVQLLKEDKKIIDQLGSFNSYSYKFVMERDSPAYYKFSLNGTSAIIYYSMEVERDSLGKWQKKSLRRDSIIKKQ